MAQSCQYLPAFTYHPRAGSAHTENQEIFNLPSQETIMEETDPLYINLNVLPKTCNRLLSFTCRQNPSRSATWQPPIDSSPQYRGLVNLAASLYKRGSPAINQKLHAQGGTGSAYYFISPHIQECPFAALHEILDPKPSDLFVVDRNWFDLWKERWFAAWKTELPCLATQNNIIVQPPGETNKIDAAVNAITDAVTDAANDDKYQRIVAIGGGITSDIAGFAAALLNIPYANAPTTLLSMVDASLGGKTGINVPAFGKNLIGRFHVPQKTITCTAFLETLPECETRQGMAEALKHMILRKCTPEKIADALEFLLQPTSDNSSELMHLLLQLVEVKRDIIEKDPYELGLRSLLNFGHTIGHGIERLSSYSINHGSAVAFGIIVELLLQDYTKNPNDLGSPHRAAAIANIICRFALAPSTSQFSSLLRDFSKASLMEFGKKLYAACRTDKKNIHSNAETIAIANLCAIEKETGEEPVSYLCEVSESEVCEAIIAISHSTAIFTADPV